MNSIIKILKDLPENQRNECIRRIQQMNISEKERNVGREDEIKGWFISKGIVLKEEPYVNIR